MRQSTERLPSESQSQDGPNEQRVFEASARALSCLSYSHIGSSHKEQQKPNQDYSDVQGDADTLFVAVGDGLGSCAFSDEGSQLVTRRVTETMRISVASSLSEAVEVSKDRVLFKAGRVKLALQSNAKETVRHPLATLDEQAFRSAFVRSVEVVRSELDALSAKKHIRETGNSRENEAEDSAEKLNKELGIKRTKDDFASTCLFAMSDGKKAFCSHVGDGGIYLVCESTSELIIEPTKGDALNETIPVTHNEWKDYLRIRVLDVPTEALFLCLMTDGFAENISKSNPNLFFQRIVGEARGKAKADFVKWLTDLNCYYESRGFSDDDKTACFVFFKNLFKEQSQ